MFSSHEDNGCDCYEFKTNNENPADRNSPIAVHIFSELSYTNLKHIFQLRLALNFEDPFLRVSNFKALKFLLFTAPSFPTKMVKYFVYEIFF